MATLWRDGSARSVEHRSVEHDASSVERGETGNDAQQRGLAAARRSEYRSNRPLGHHEIDALQHMTGSIGLVQPADDQTGVVLVVSRWGNRQAVHSTIQPLRW